jgi:ligand-binding sensor domain-containing protein
MKKLITIFTFYIHVITFLSAGETVLIPSFLQEKRQFELEGQKVYSVSIMDNGTIYAGTETGLYVNSIDESDWEKVAKIDSPTYLVATNINKVIAVSGNLFNNILAQGKVHLIQNKKVIQIVNIPNNIKIDIHRSDLITKGFQGIIGTNDEIYIFHLGTTRERGKKHIKPISLNLGHGNINQLYAKNKQLIYAATQNGLFHKKGKSWTKIEPSSGHRSWALADCRSVAIDSKNRLGLPVPKVWVF